MGVDRLETDKRAISLNVKDLLYIFKKMEKLLKWGHTDRSKLYGPEVIEIIGVCVWNREGG